MVAPASKFVASLLPMEEEFFCPREVAAHLILSLGHMADLIDERALKGCVDLRVSGVSKAMWRIPKYSLITFLNFRQTKILGYRYEPNFAERVNPDRLSFRLPELARLLRCSSGHLENLIDAGDLAPVNPITAETKRSSIRVSREALIGLLYRRLNK